MSADTFAYGAECRHHVLLDDGCRRCETELPASTDTPPPERVTLTGEERVALSWGVHDARGSSLPVEDCTGCGTITSRLGPVIEGILAAREQALREEIGVLWEVAQERHLQDIEWGEQNHPNGTGPEVRMTLDNYGYLRRHGISYADLADWARGHCDQQHAAGLGTFEHILTEEWAEAIASEDPADLRAELIQVAAVAVAWVEKIDRDAAHVARGGAK